MRTKISEFNSSVNICVYDIIVLVETWLTQDFLNSEFDLHNFIVYRCDRSQQTSDKKRGGGILIAIRKNIVSKQINLMDSVVEQLFVQFTIGNNKYMIGGVYIPPRSSFDLYNVHVMSLFELIRSYPDHELIIFGDYNIPDTLWIQSDDGLEAVCPDSSPGKFISDSFSAYGLQQCNKFPNNHGVFLDLLFSYQKYVVTPAVDTLLDPNYHHISYCFCFPINNTAKSLQYDICYYDYKNANWVGINDYFASVDWSSLYECKYVDYALQIFYDTVYYAISIFVPIKRFKSSHFPPWFSSELKSLVTHKKIAHRNFKMTGNEFYYNEFSDLRRRCKVVSDACYRVYLSRIEENIQNDSNTFWRYVNNLRNVNSIPNSMYLDSVTSTNGLDTVNLFAQYFSTVYSNYQGPIQSIPKENLVDIPKISISTIDVFEGIESLKNKFSHGPDGIPSVFLKSCICTLTHPIFFIFSLSLHTKEFPSFWKNSFITPIFKSGDRSNVENYRGICIQSVLPKLFDKIISVQLSWLCKNIIIPQQHGFSAGRSTVTNLLSYQQYILNALERGLQVDSIYTDFSKAFDRVNHALLIEKLNSIGFGDSIVMWVSSFLSDRTQQVRINNFISNPIKVCSGVPQGSHCGPLFFNLFINDMSKIITSAKFLFFADDLKLFHTIRCLSDSQDLQNDIDQVYNWSVNNYLNLNISKCCSISFYRSHSCLYYDYNINDAILKNVVEVKDLGVIFDQRLNFKSHLIKVSSTCNKTLGFVIRNSKQLSTNTVKILYCSLIRSSLDYACVIWSPYYQCDVDLIENVQIRFARYVHYKLTPHEQFCYPNILSRLHLTKLSARHFRIDLIFMFKIVNGLYDCTEILDDIKIFVSPYNTRNSYLFVVNFHNTNYGFNSPISRILRNFNRYNIDPFSCSLSKFKSNIGSLPMLN